MGNKEGLRFQGSMWDELLLPLPPLVARLLGILRVLREETKDSGLTGKTGMAVLLGRESLLGAPQFVGFKAGSIEEV